MGSIGQRNARGSFIEFDAVGELCNVALPAQPIDDRRRTTARVEERANGEFLDLMQFTGFKNRNRVDIYEGDIFLTEDTDVTKIEALSVEFVDGCWMLTGSLSGMRVQLNDWVMWPVAGNIYQNPDLLH